MKTITSRQNSLIKSLCELHTAKGRLAQRRFLAEGDRTISALMQSGHKAEIVLALQEHLSGAQQFCCDNALFLVSPEVMHKVSTQKSPPGMIGIFTIPDAPDADSLRAGLVLANITNPGNMGTLIRTAAAMNVKSVVVIDGVDPWSPKVVQSSAGTIGFVNLFRWSWDELIAKKKNLALCALVVNGGESPAKIDFADTLIAVGNEAHGLPDAWVAQCEKQCTITMPGKTESLNAAVAGSLALYAAFGTD